jgi:hypothetical protein
MAEQIAKIEDATVKDCKTSDNDGALITALVQALGTPSTQGYTKLPLYDNGAAQPSGVANGNLWAASAIGGGYNMYFHKGSVNEQVILEDYTLSGDITGTPDATIVSKIQGDEVYASIAPSAGDVLTWDDGNSRWDATAASSVPSGNDGDLIQCTGGTTYVARGAGTGDRILDTVYGTSWNLSTSVIVGTYLKIKSDRLTLGDQGASTPGTPVDGDVWFNNSGLQFYEGSAKTVVTTGYSLGTDLSGTISAPTVAKIQNYSVQSGAPATNDILQYISSSWQHVAGLTPDYDSGWFGVNRNTAYTKTHSLGVLPRQVQVYVSENSNGSPAQLAGWGWMHGTENECRGTIVCDITTTTLSVRTGARASPYGTFDSYGFAGTRVNLGDSEYCRVICWK